MVIYIDVLFIVNLYVDYFILLLVKDYLHIDVKTYRLVFGALIGAGFSLISLLNIGVILNLLLSVIISGLICFVAFYKGNKLLIVKSCACFLFSSFLLSGSVLLLSQFTGTIALVGITPYFQISLLQLFVFTVLSYLSTKVLHSIRGKYDDVINFKKLVVEVNNKTLEIFGKIDTGNNLKEPFSNLPVLVVEKTAILETDEEITENFRIIPYNSIGGSGILKAFKPTKIYLKENKQELNAYIALHDGKLSAGTYNCLINPDAL